jgi:flagellar biosynthesis protein FlhG
VEGEYVNDQAQKLRMAVARSKSSLESGALSQKSYEASGSGNQNLRKCKSIAITSGKGGVGKTNISLSIGLALSYLKKKVCIVDADLGLANIHILLGIAPKRNLSHLVNEECALSEIISSGPGGIDILPGASGMERLANIDPSSLRILRKKLAELENMYDYLVIDTGAGISRGVTEFAANADLGVIVVTPEPASLADAYAMVKVLYEKNTSRLSALVNMAGNDKEGKETFDKLNTLVVKFLRKPLGMAGMLPFDKQVPALAKRQKLAFIENPGALFSIRIKNCARAVSGVQSIKKEGFFKRIFGYEILD